MNGSEKGFSTLEAIIAVAILSIGAVGIFGMVVTSNEALERAATKEEYIFQMQEMFEVIQSNKQNALLFNQINLSSCAISTALKNAISAAEVKKTQKWCARIKGEGGVAANNSPRRILVEEKSVYDPSSKTTSKFNIVTVELTDDRGKSYIAARRVLNAN